MTEFITYLLVLPLIAAVVLVGGLAFALIVGAILYPLVWLAQVFGIVNSPEDN